MSRRRWIYVEGRGLVDVTDYVPPPRKTPYIGRPDTTEPFKSHADGKMYTSLSRYRAEYRARGLECVGNERAEFDPVPQQPGDPTDDLKRSFSELGLPI